MVWLCGWRRLDSLRWLRAMEMKAVLVGVRRV